MLHVVNITDDDIAFAEQLLLPKECHFDEERKAFIADFSTLDLQAVPGSGKTTALLAKLLILDRYLPFSDGSGVLVISHTNAAVDEIKNKIGKCCTNLFRYPSFIGTIQSFVDTFLATPFYINQLKKRPTRIDNEIYEEEVSKFSTCFFKGFTRGEQNNAKSFLRSNDLFLTIRFGQDENGIKLTNRYYGKDIDIKKPKGNTKPANYSDWTDLEKQKVADWLLKFKKRILQWGILCFDDAYFLAFEYLRKYPKQKKLLQKRFHHVFVDEMQDMDRHQYDLLEAIFFDNSMSPSVYQRIGDKNQSIYNGDAKLEEIWVDRYKVHELNGSHRLSKKIATVVQPFGLRPIQIDGQKKNPDGSEIDINPLIIVYSSETIEQVIPAFASLIKELVDAGKLPFTNNYKAIAWNAKPEEGKTRLVDYFPGFSRDIHKPKIDHTTLNGCISSCYPQTFALESVRAKILSAFVKILRLENCHNQNGRLWSKSDILRFLSENDQKYYESFKLKIYQWSMGLIRNQKQIILDDIKNSISDFFEKFSQIPINHSNGFINNPHDEGEEQVPNNAEKNSNIFKANGIEVEVTTVHSVKGQTHIATLYLETFYQRGDGNFESERLCNQIKGQQIGNDKINIVKQSSKMMYVGLSRPSHFLCLAIQKERFDEKLNDINTEIWDIKDIR